MCQVVNQCYQGHLCPGFPCSSVSLMPPGALAIYSCLPHSVFVGVIVQSGHVVVCAVYLWLLLLVVVL